MKTSVVGVAISGQLLESLVTLKRTVSIKVSKLPGKVLKIPGVLFGILTICGVIFVLGRGGQANAGYAVIPMVFCMLFIALARKKRNDN
jgi:hypothetical protein